MSFTMSCYARWVDNFKKTTPKSQNVFRSIFRACRLHTITNSISETQKDSRLVS